MPEEKTPVLLTPGILPCRDRGCTLLWLAEARIAAFEGALRGEKFARAELEQEVARLRDSIGVCDKHGTLNYVMDAWCLKCDEEYNGRKRREQH